MILKVNNISKSFRNGEKTLSVFSDVSIEIESGDLITIMGPSGSGKSTLLNILGTLDTADSGSIILNGMNMAGLSQNDIASVRNTQLGFVFQFHHLLPEFTALENVLIPNQIKGKDGDIEKGKNLLDYMGLSERVDHFPSQLSGGERLRVAVVRALMNDPTLVFADEPTGNLDRENANRLVELFKKINRDLNQAFVVTTHNPDVASIGKKQFYLSEGTLSFSDRV